MKKLTTLMVFLIVLALSFMAALAADNFTFNFQGRLNNGLGQPVPDGNYQVSLFIYTDSIGGTPRWSENHPSVHVSGGFFNLVAGSLTPCPIGIAAYDDLYVAAKIGTEPPMSPRMKISSSPNSGVARRLYGDLQSSPGALRFLDDGSEYMGIGPSPFRQEGSLNMYDSTGVNTISLSSTGKIGFLDDGSEYMGIEPSPWHAGGDIIMKNLTGAQTMRLGSDGTIGMIDDGSEYMGVEPSPFHAGGDLIMKAAGGVQTMVLGSNGTMSMLDDGSKYMGVEPSPWHTGGDLMMYSVGGGPTLMLASNGQVSIGTGERTNILTIARGAATYPIADGWAIYNSRRWKTNIQPLTGSLDKVMRLQGVSYDRRENSKHEIGLVAEDVGQVIPEVVSYEDNGIDARSIDYARLTALLVEAVKEQQQTIEQQNARIEKLENELNKLGIGKE